MDRHRYPARSFRVDPALWDKVKIIAERRDTSVTKIVTRLLEQYVARNAK